MIPTAVCRIGRRGSFGSAIVERTGIPRKRQVDVICFSWPPRIATCSAFVIGRQLVSARLRDEDRGTRLACSREQESRVDANGFPVSARKVSRTSARLRLFLRRFRPMHSRSRDPELLQGGSVMKNPMMTDASRCVLCDGRLRNAIFCPSCGESSCSWACYMRHLGQHSRMPGHSPSYSSDSRRDDGPGPAGEQMAQC